MNDSELGNEKISTIDAGIGWQLINFKELFEYRDLFFFLVWRDIKVLYAQTILGFAWAILNPFIYIVIFSIIFGKIAKFDTGDIPYELFVTTSTVPWIFMSTAMAASSQSLVSGKAMLGKIYFPRLIFPLTPIFSKLVDFGISLVLIVGSMIYFQVSVSSNVLLLPLALILMIVVPAGIGMWLSALAIRYRDVKFAMSHIIGLLLYSAPITYPLSEIIDKMPDWMLFIYSLNPIVAVIELFHVSLLGWPVQWSVIIPGMIMSVLVLVSGAFYFKKMERIFVDVI